MKFNSQYVENCPEIGADGKKLLLSSFFFIFIIILLNSCAMKKTDYTGAYTSTKVGRERIHSRIDRKFFNYEGLARNPVIMIHGFLGSRLIDKKNSETIWGNFKAGDMLVGFSNNELKPLAYPMEFKKPLSEINDNVKSTSILFDVDVRILGLYYKLRQYSELKDELTNLGYTDEKHADAKGKNYATLFTFHYDWRRSNDENAAALHKFILEKKKYMTEVYERVYGIKDFGVKFDIIAHSMGGLVSRYYIRYGNQQIKPGETLPVLDWRGAENIDKMIIIGTPNLGYLNTCFEMVRGLRIAEGMPKYPPGVIGTWPSYYQMMPPIITNSLVYKRESGGKRKTVNIFDPKMWKELNWGLMNRKQEVMLRTLLPNAESATERRKIAYDHLKKSLRKAEIFIELLARHDKAPDDISFFLFLGNSIKTRLKASVDKKTGQLKVLEYDSGDGVVTSSSALMDLRMGRKWTPFFKSPINWQSVYFTNEAHLGLTESLTLRNNLLYCLTNIKTGYDEKIDKLFEELNTK